MCVAAPAMLSAQENSDADELHRLRWRDPIAARELQDERLRTCFNPLTPPSTAIQICTWVIDAARVAGNYAGEAFVRRAAAYAALGDVQQADEDFRNGTTIWDQVAPDAPPPNIEVVGGPAYGLDRARHANAHCERGEFYWRQGDTERALASYRRAQEYDPQCAATPLAAIAAGQASPRAPLRDLGRYDASQHLNVATLTTACATQRTAALQATYGPEATAEQAAGLDGAFAQSSLSSRDTSVLLENYRVFEAGAADNAALAYAACLYRQRLTSIDPQWEEAANEAVEAEEPEDDPFANLPRREAGAGTQFLADSADPNVRAARLRAAAERAAQAERRREERRRQSAAMWDTILQVAAIGAQTYLEYESQRISAEAAAQQQAAILAQQQAQAQARAQQAARQQQQQQQQVMPPSNTGNTSVEGQNQIQEPAGQRIYDTPEQYAASNGGANGQRQMLNPQTGRPCVTQTNTTTLRHSNGDIAHRIHFANSCGATFSVYARRIPGPNGTYHDGVSGTGISEYGQMYLTCIERANPTGNSCRGFSEWWVR